MIRLHGPLRIIFWGGTPLAVVFLLCWPDKSVVFIGTDSISLNPVPPGLPSPLAEFLFFYPTTLFALTVLTGFAIWQWACRQPEASPRMQLSLFFLPTYVAVLESIELLIWSLRCHSVTATPPLTEVIAEGARLTGATLITTMVLGGLAAHVFGHRSRIGLPVCTGAVAVITSLAQAWWLLWALIIPPWSSLSIPSYVLLNEAIVALVGSVQLLAAVLRGYRVVRATGVRRMLGIDNDLRRSTLHQ
jgi:hypothetical protein